jgi:hypothetical protein
MNLYAEDQAMSEQPVKPPKGAEPREVVVYGSAKGFAQKIAVGGHQIGDTEGAGACKPTGGFER